LIETLTINERVVYDYLQCKKSQEVFMVRKSSAQQKITDFTAVFDGRPVKSMTELHSTMREQTYACYGAGVGCGIFLREMEKHDLKKNCRAIFDTDESLHGGMVAGVAISQFEQIIADEVSKIVITPYTYSISDEVKDYLISIGVDESRLVLLSDYIAINDLKAYFDTQICGQPESNEIFVDAGCLDFSTSCHFLKYYPNAMKIYAIEPNDNQIAVIRRNIEKTGFKNVKVINGALWSHDTTLSFNVHETKSASRVSENELSQRVKAYALDSIVKTDERITFIKMDVEGAELEALKGSEATIKRCRPKLAISVYHKPMDYVDIPLYIKSIVPEYKMYLRHYTNVDTETVLYAVM